MTPTNLPNLEAVAEKIVGSLPLPGESEEYFRRNCRTVLAILAEALPEVKVTFAALTSTLPAAGEAEPKNSAPICESIGCLLLRHTPAIEARCPKCGSSSIGLTTNSNYQFKAICGDCGDVTNFEYDSIKLSELAAFFTLSPRPAAMPSER